MTPTAGKATLSIQPVSGHTLCASSSAPGTICPATSSRPQAARADGPNLRFRPISPERRQAVAGNYNWLAIALVGVLVAIACWSLIYGLIWLFTGREARVRARVKRFVTEESE